jgi:hypothetical protein
MKTFSLLIVSLLLVMTTACGYNTGVSSSEPVSYIYFTGDAEGAEVFIDDTSAFVVNKTGNKNQYKVSPGKHVITIKKGNKVLVKRSVLLGDGHEKEFNVPKL